MWNRSLFMNEIVFVQNEIRAKFRFFFFVRRPRSHFSTSINFDTEEECGLSSERL